MSLWLLSLFFLGAASQALGVVRSFVRYPGAKGQFRVTGNASISGGPDQFTLEMYVTDLTANSLHGVHIHSGVTCADATLVGGHFWAGFTSPDPWNAIKFMASAAGLVAEAKSVSFGYSAESFVGHAMVIHDPTGARLACGIIEDPDNGPIDYTSATLSTYPGYTGNLTATGTVEVWDLPNNGSQIVNFRLKGLQPNATGGVHIHVGLTCAGSGLHYYTGSRDPWSAATYEANDLGVAEGSVTVASGYFINSYRFHAFVIHDDANVRIACGLLGVIPTLAPTPVVVVCPSVAIQAVFTSCNATDLHAKCTPMCETSTASMTSAFVAANTSLIDSTKCLDSANATTPWVDGDLDALKAKLNFDGVPICPPSPTPAPAPIPSSAQLSAATFGVAVISPIVALFL